MKRRFRRGRRAEERAPRLLAREGFEVLDEQANRDTGLWVDEVWQPVTVRADYLARRRGQTYVVEVKSGRKAPNPASPLTRRQLFEYHHVYDADGLVLADMETERLHLIRFDRGASSMPEPRGGDIWLLAGAALLLGLVIGVAGAALVGG
jgi:Holliday junction resolvase-like predicted endonuclease